MFTIFLNRGYLKFTTTVNLFVQNGNSLFTTRIPKYNYSTMKDEMAL